MSSHRMAGRKQHHGACFQVAWPTAWSARAFPLPAAPQLGPWHPFGGQWPGGPLPSPHPSHTPPAEFSTHSIWKNLRPRPQGHLLPGRGSQSDGQRTPGPGEPKPQVTRPEEQKKNSGFGCWAPPHGEEAFYLPSSAHSPGISIKLFR